MANQLPLPSGAISSPYELALETRSRWQIPNETKLEKCPEALEDSRKFGRKGHETAQLLCLSAVYNCIGLVVAARRTCILPEYLLKILKDDEYREVPDITQVGLSDVVAYVAEEEVTHAGFIVWVEKDIPNAVIKCQVLSKWGFGGEYIHDINDVPSEYGKPSLFFTKRTNSQEPE